MIFIPGVLIALITFPGVIVHELVHQFFCYIMRVPVYAVKYFQFQRPYGYVIHEASDKPLSNFVISMGPFFGNTLIGALILLPASYAISMYNVLGGQFGFAPQELLAILAIWLGISIIMHSFPSTGDAKVLVDTVLKNPNVSFGVKLLVAPFVGLVYLGAFGSIVWLDLGYAVLVGYGVSKLLIWLL